MVHSVGVGYIGVGLAVLVFWVQVKKGPQKGQMQEVIKRKNSLAEIMKVSLRYKRSCANSMFFIACRR